MANATEETLRELRDSASTAASTAGSPGAPLPDGAQVIAGADAGGLVRVPRVDGLGAVATMPDALRNGVYLGIQRTLSQRIVSIGSIVYSLDSNKWSSVLSGGGATAFDPTFGEAKLSVGGAAGDRALLLFNNVALFGAGHGNFMSLAFRVDQPTLPGKFAEWGAFSDVGSAAPLSTALGFYLIDGVFGVFLRAAGIPTARIPQAAFSIDRLDGNGPSGATLAPSDLIHSTAYGVFVDYQVIFYVGDKPVTAVDFGTPSTSLVPTIARRPAAFRLGYLLEDTSNNGVPSNLWTHIAYAEAIGDALATSEPYCAAGVLSATVQSGASAPIFALRPAATIGGVVNGKRILPRMFSITSSAVGRVALYYGTTSDLTLTGASFAAPTQAPQSAAEIDASATAVVVQSTARQIAPRAVEANVPLTVRLDDFFGVSALELTIRGDGLATMIVAIFTNAGAGPATVRTQTLEWTELI